MDYKFKLGSDFYGERIGRKYLREEGGGRSSFLDVVCVVSSGLDSVYFIFFLE